VFRPADAHETAAGWYLATIKKDGPIALVLTRQTLPLFETTGLDALKGAYILHEPSGSTSEIAAKDATAIDGSTSMKAGTPDVILMASGSEVKLIVEAAAELATQGIKARVVSIPSFELFEAQDEAYKESVLPSSIKARVAVEAGSSFGWHRYTGLDGRVIGLDHFGVSGKPEMLFEAFGFTVENVIKKVKETLFQ
jgi:transketolase